MFWDDDVMFICGADGRWSEMDGSHCTTASASMPADRGHAFCAGGGGGA